MASTVAPGRPSPHPELPEMARKSIAKAVLRKADATPEVRQQVGRAIARAGSICGWTLKEFAAYVGRDPRQLARWISGVERPHFDALFAVPELRQPLVQALSELAGADVEINIKLRVAR